MIEGKTIDEVFSKIKLKLISASVITVRGLKTKELTHEHIVISDVFKCILSDQKSNYYQYALKELFLYMKGTILAEEFEEASSFWKHVKNKDNTVTSNYGSFCYYKYQNMMPQFEWCVQEFLKDMHTRKAVIVINERKHKDEKIKDFPCTMFVQFIIRNNTLESSIHMRSNDAIFGFRYDVLFFCFLHIQLFLRLKAVYPQLKSGCYHHYATSLHIYEKHFEMLQ